MTATVWVPTQASRTPSNFQFWARIAESTLDCQQSYRRVEKHSAANLLVFGELVGSKGQRGKSRIFYNGARGRGRTPFINK